MQIILGCIHAFFPKILITGVLIFSGFLAGNVVAEGTCATAECDTARKIPNLPSDVKSFVDQRDGCDHFRGEPWFEGDDPEVTERRIITRDRPPLSFDRS